MFASHEDDRTGTVADEVKQMERREKEKEELTRGGGSLSPGPAG